MAQRSNAAPGHKTTGYRPFKGFGIETEVPGWALSCLAVIGLVGAAAALWFNVIEKHLIQDQEPQSVQLRETAKHYWETPAFHAPPYKDWRGELDLAFFASDGCVRVTRRSADPSASPVMTWIFDSSKLPKSATTPPKFSSAPSPGLVAEAEARGRCYAPGGHPGPFHWWGGTVQGCWQQIWNQWPDGCTGWYARNNCYNTVGPFTWTACIH